MLHSISLRAAARLSALSFLLCPYRSAFAQSAIAGFDVFVTPTDNEVVNAGSNFDIIWTPSDPAGPVTIRLMQGPTELTQEFGPTIASGIDSTSGKYTWSIPSSYGDYATYGFKLQLDSDPTIFQYSYPFIIKKISSPTSAPASQPPATTSTALATSTSILVLTQDTTPDNPSTQKPQTSAQSVVPSSNSPSVTSSVVSSAAKSGTSSPTNAPSSSTSLSASSPTTSALSPVSPTAAISQTVTSAPSPSAAASTNNDLSVGAKAGIAIGSVVGIGIIALLAYIALLMRRKSTRRDLVGGEEEHKISEMGSGLAHEMEGVEKTSELESGEPFQVAWKDERFRGSRRLEDIAEMG